jgi:hypothetical protein
MIFFFSEQTPFLDKITTNGLWALVDITLFLYIIHYGFSIQQVRWIVKQSVLRNQIKIIYHYAKQILHKYANKTNNNKTYYTSYFKASMS